MPSNQASLEDLLSHRRRGGGVKRREGRMTVESCRSTTLGQVLCHVRSIVCFIATTPDLTRASSGLGANKNIGHLCSGGCLHFSSTSIVKSIIFFGLVSN